MPRVRKVKSSEGNPLADPKLTPASTAPEPKPMAKRQPKKKVLEAVETVPPHLVVEEAKPKRKYVRKAKVVEVTEPVVEVPQIINIPGVPKRERKKVTHTDVSKLMKNAEKMMADLDKASALSHKLHTQHLTTERYKRDAKNVKEYSSKNVNAMLKGHYDPLLNAIKEKLNTYRPILKANVLESKRLRAGMKVLREEARQLRELKKAKQMPIGLHKRTKDGMTVIKKSDEGEKLHPQSDFDKYTKHLASSFNKARNAVEPL